MISHVRRHCLWAVLAMCAMSAPVFAQATLTSAMLRGTVTDASGALVPQAGVTATDEATGVSQKTVTDASGRYLFNNLRPSTYSVLLKAQGFRETRQTGIILHLGQQADLNFSLQLGSVATTIDVEGTAPVLNTTSAALAQDIETKMTINLPLFDRQAANLALLTPGVTATNGGGGYAPAGTGGIGYSNINFVANGQRNSTAEARIDGALSTMPETGGGGTNLFPFSPSPEIVQEFKVQTSSFSAEYGSNGGTVMSLVTKSGTNTFHGSAYYFARRPELDANNFFANESGTPKADYKRDNFGGVISGPVKKNKLFFLFAYDKVVFDSPDSIRTTVPTDLQKQGNYSQSLNSDGSLRTIFNPRAAYQDAQGNWIRPAFVGNIIPASMMDPVAMKLVGFYPGGNTQGDPNTGFNNFYKAGVDTVRINGYDGKLDYYLSDSQRLTGRYSYHPYSSKTALFFGNPMDGGSATTIDNTNAVLEHTWTINPSWIWTNRVSVNRRLMLNGGEVSFDPTSIGFSRDLINANGSVAMPSISVGQYAGMGVGGWVVTRDGGTQWAFSSAASHTQGNHNMKFGFDESIFLENFYQPGFQNGAFGFSADRTNQAVFGGAAGQGDALASMQLGFSDWGSINIQPGTATKSRNTAFYFQDDWRINDRLTLNMGLRYGWTSPFTERYNRTGIANTGEDSGINVPGLGEIYGVNDFVTSSHRTVAADRGDIAPRLGFAYRLSSKTVVRGGAGIYYGITTPGQNNWYTAPADRSSAGANFTLDGGITQAATLGNPWPNGLPYPQGQKYGKLNMWGFGSDNGWSFGSDPIHDAEIYQWNAGVQHQLTKSLSVELSYVGNRSTHLPVGSLVNRDILPDAAKQQYSLQDLGTNVANPFQYLFVGPKAIFNEPASVYNNPTIPRDWLLRPFPQFAGTFNGNTKAIAVSRYNAMQLRVEQRFQNGVSFVANYSYSQQKDDSSEGLANWMAATTGYQNPNNISQEYSVGASAIPQHFLFASVYELPFGRGKRFGSSWGKLADGVLGGWQVAGVLTMQSGYPLHVVMAAGRLSDGSQRPNVVAGINPRTSSCSIKQVVDFACAFFNSAAFADPAEQQYGDAPRYFDNLRQQGVSNVDFSLIKTITFRERYKVQLRGEAFNALNRTLFGAPNTGWCSTGDCGFGQITSTANDPRKLQMGARFEF